MQRALIDLLHRELAGTRPTSRQLGLCAIAAAAGFAVNYFALPVFGGTSMVFGSVFGVLAAIAYGPYAGGTVAGVAFLQTWIAWGHPHGVIVFAIESWVIGWLVHRRGLAVWRAGLIYWLVIGVPLTAVLILGFFRPPFPANWAIVFKYPANGMLVVLLAQTIAHFRGFWRLLREPLPEPLRHENLGDHLLRKLVVAVAWPALLFGLAVGVMFNFQTRATLQRELRSTAHEVAGTVAAYLRRHQGVLETAAASLEHRSIDDAELSRLLDEFRRRNPGFLTMLATDSKGVVVANSPAVPAGASIVVADREYFRQPRPGEEAYVSPVFRGRGFGNEMIVAVSVAFLDAAGERRVIEGSLNLRFMGEEIARAPNLGWRELLLFDAQRQPVFHPEGAQELNFEALPRSVGDEVINDDTTTDEDGQVFRKYAIWQRVPHYDWHVYLREDAWHSVAGIARFYFAGAAALGGILVVGLLLSRQTVRRLSQPFTRLVGYTDALARGVPPPELVEEENVPDEWRRLAQDVTAAASTLAEANSRLGRAIEEREVSHAALEELTAELEERVRQRTAELEKARAEAERASRAKSEFLAMVSHELRTPLNVQLGHIYLLLNHRTDKLTGPPAERVRQIKASADQLLALINDILDLAKLEAGRTSLEIEAVDVRRLCEECGAFFREEFARTHLTFTLDVKLAGGRLHADPRRLRQVLLNLLSNAVKFTPEGGSVGLIAFEDQQRQEVVFTVWDSGIGIGTEQQQRLFRPFEQVDGGLSRKYSGTGLGLSIVKRLTDLHGGTVSLESAPNRGSRFTVTVPFSPAPHPEPVRHESAPPAHPAR